MTTIASGKYEGKPFLIPAKLKWSAPPLLFRQKVFTLLQTPVAHKVVLDLFAGTGLFTTELLSQGAMKVVIAEDNPQWAAVAQQNLTQLKATNYELHTAGHRQLLKTKTGSQFDLVFVHPFRDDGKVVNKTLKILTELKLLSQHGQIVVFGYSATTLTLPRVMLPQGLIVQRSWQSANAYVLIIANI